MLPRVYMYFDDIFGEEGDMHSSFTGERLAISEYNASHEQQKISAAFHLRNDDRYHGLWRNSIYIYHDFDHPYYCRFTGLNTAGPTSMHLE